VEFNLADLFEAVAEAVPGREALVVGRGGVAVSRATYAELDVRANRLANGLVGLGIGPGDHVGLHLFNDAEYVEAMLAAYKLRAVPVNVNYRYVAEELDYLFRDADLVAVITEPELAAVVEEVAADVPLLDHVVVRGQGYEALLASSSARPPIGARSGDDLYLLYTGGTTGRPKGVMWRHEDIYFASLGGRGTPSQGVPALERPEDVRGRALGVDPIRRRLPLCPLIHGGAMWIALQSLLSGGTVVLDADRHFAPEAALGLMSGEWIDLIMVIGDATARPLVDALHAAPGVFDLSSLRVIASGGAVLSPAVQAELRALLPTTKVVDTFGASETGGQGRLTGSRPGLPPRLLTDPDTAVLDDELRPVEPGSGRIGHLARRGRIPFGYYKDTEKTAATFPLIDGVRWAVPGDQALVEADGSITLLGRGSQCINTGGEKVYPEEVEGVLKHHPAVFDALVIGVPDERFGQRVAAVVALRPGSVPEGQPIDALLEAHAREHLSGYKVPRTWVHVDRCARLPTGKADYATARRTALEALGLTEPS